jgi:DNA-binding NarL/FixJ family response regulator
MPGVPGEDTVRALRAIDPAVRVLLSSGYGEVEAQRRFADLQIAGFIAKPYTVGGLALAVKAACAPAPPSASAATSDI